MFEEFFNHRKPNAEKLVAFGFTPGSGVNLYKRAVMNGDFDLCVEINSAGKVDTRLTEAETGEEYVLYKTEATGVFVGQVRAEIASVLREISEECFDQAIFKAPQTETVIKFVKEKFGDDLEFLWPLFPENAIWRRKDNAKWYGLIMTVDGRKIGLDTDGKAEVIDLRTDPGKRDAILALQGRFPAWHMNKNSWYTVVLNGVVPDGEIESAISESYTLAAGPKGKTNG